MNRWPLDDGRKIDLLTPEQLKALPDDQMIVNIFGETRRKVEPDKGPPDDDTRFGFTAWGKLVTDEQLTKEGLSA